VNEPESAAIDMAEQVKLAQAEFESRLAMRIAAALAEMAGGFPNAEDIALIRDHISPNGVAYQNGKRAGRAEAAEEIRQMLETHGSLAFGEWLTKEHAHGR
jgi:hypothetical protein